MKQKNNQKKQIPLVSALLILFLILFISIVLGKIWVDSYISSAQKSMQVDNINTSNAISNSHINFVNSGLEDADGGTNYQLDTEDWSTTDATKDD